MYGLLLENLATFIKAQWGEGKWESVRRHAGIDLVAFSIHHVYPETLLRRLARSAFQVLGVDERQFFEAMGVYFVQYVSQYGYDQLLSVLGRHMRDFLNGLDNLHEYLKFSYPKMRAPSFYCDDETESGLKLHYRSKRRGFVYYVMGQIKQVANQFYNQECQILLLSEEVVGETMHVVFQLTFDNSAFTEAEAIRTLIGKDLRLPVRASTLFELFPFCIVFNSEMEITHTGHTLMTILKDLVGQIMTEAFDMTRPLIPFCFSAIMQRRNNIFELVTVAPIHDVNQLCGAIDSFDEETEGTRLKLRGQMLYMEDWNMMLYLANPVMPDLNGLVDAGLFINDLSLHDCSRDLVLAGTQQSVELKLALDQEQQKSRKLVQSMKKLDEEMRRTDELLYQMIPKEVADRIRKGENPVETCQTFESVSILFTDVVNFTSICSMITPLQVVTMLNHMYFLFDQLTERNGVYKVETVGDSYMVVSGAPVQDARHAERICDMAMDIIDASEAIEDPSGSCGIVLYVPYVRYQPLNAKMYSWGIIPGHTKGLRVRVGVHSGGVVAGVVGVKMPRYCLFGDTVNTASRMESTGEPGKIQISESCKNLLPPLYTTDLRGTLNVKGKGDMYTYWLNAREARVPLSKYYSKSIIWSAPSPKLLEGIGNRPISPTHIKYGEVSHEENSIELQATQVPAGATISTGIAIGLGESTRMTFKPLKGLSERPGVHKTSGIPRRNQDPGRSSAEPFSCPFAALSRAEMQSGIPPNSLQLKLNSETSTDHGSSGSHRSSLDSKSGDLLYYDPTLHKNLTSATEIAEKVKPSDPLHAMRECYSVHDSDLNVTKSRIKNKIPHDCLSLKSIPEPLKKGDFSSKRRMEMHKGSDHESHSNFSSSEDRSITTPTNSVHSQSVGNLSTRRKSSKPQSSNGQTMTQEEIKHKISKSYSYEK